MSETAKAEIKMWEDLLNQETQWRGEIIAWRNTFPDRIYDARNGMIVKRDQPVTPRGPASQPTGGAGEPTRG